jgi:hypothetical protein
MDWSLARCRSKDYENPNPGLRHRLMFYRKRYYYAAILIDLVLRFTWTLTLLPRGHGSPFPANFMVYASPCIAIGEVGRKYRYGVIFCFVNKHTFTHTLTYSYRSNMTHALQAV